MSDFLLFGSDLIGSESSGGEMDCDDEVDENEDDDVDTDLTFSATPGAAAAVD